MGNLVGALLTRQAGWQVIVAGYYVFVDVTLVFQFFWYTHYKGRRESDFATLTRHDDNASPGVFEGFPFPEDGASRAGPSPQAEPRADSKDAMDAKNPGSCLVNNASFANEKSSSSRRTVVRSSNTSNVQSSAARSVLLASMLCAVAANAAPTDTDPLPPQSGLTLQFLGSIFSWMSTVLYLGSRPPQLYKNYRRKSTSGLSPLLFTAAFCGNLFYSSSLVTNPNAWYDFGPYGGGGWADADGNNRADWVMRAIPFFLGAFGVLFLDGFMGVQFLMYGSDDESVIEVDDPKRGRSRWKRVRGWMRGWIPSPARKRASDAGAGANSAPEDQTLLHGDRQSYGAV